jgi:hypothetical protein
MSNDATASAPAPAQADQGSKPEETKATPSAAPAAEPPKEATKPDAVPKEGEVKPQANAKPDEKQAESQKKVPEKYDLKLPDDSLLDASITDKVALIAKERGLSNEEAQALVDNEHNAVKAFVAERTQTWLSASENDKEIGGQAFKENAEIAKRVVSRYGTDSLKKELNRTGYGNHPELVRLLYRIGKEMAPDKLIVPTAQAAGKKPVEEYFYGGSEKKT